MSVAKSNPVMFLGAAALVGAVVGVGSIAATPQNAVTAMVAVKSVAVAGGIIRKRAPQAGDFWSGCNDARVSGSVPLYRGEPGYREAMDGDGDGVACENYAGSPGSSWHRRRRRHH